MLQSARMLAPLVVLAMIAPAIGPAIAQLCHTEAPATPCCKERCSMRHAPKPASESPPVKQPVAKPCCALAAEPATAPSVVPAATKHLLAAVSTLSDDDAAALRVPPRVQILRDTGPPAPSVRSHLAVSVLLI